jgi:hypothetical protein
VWNGYVVYASGTTIGRAPIEDAASKNDSYITTLDDAEYHPMVSQGGTLKIGAGRYVATLDESFTFVARAMKLPVGYNIKCMTEFLGRLFIGPVATGGVEPLATSSIFEWRGITIASGSALPDVAYALNVRGIHALVTNGGQLFAFPGFDGGIWAFTGSSFTKVRDTFSQGLGVPEDIVKRLSLGPNSVTSHGGSLFYGGKPVEAPGVYQFKSGALTQSLVPATAVPGDDSQEDVTLIKHALVGNLYLGVTDPSSGTHTLQAVSSTTRKNSAFARTVWHRFNTDRFKRMAGVRLNLKPMAANTAVTVGFRTGRDESFTNAPHTITSTNQYKPVLFTVRPRAHEIQFKFTYTISGSSTPELLSYNPIFEVLTATR